MVVRVKAAVTVSTNLTDGILGAGRFAAGVLRVAVLSRVIRHIAVFIGTLMPVMRCIGRPIGLPAVAGGIDWLRLCRVAYGTGICLFARFCAGRRCCYRTVVPSMRAYVILFIATGTLLPVHVIIMCPTGSKIMSQNIAIFRTAIFAFCFLGAGCRTAGVLSLIHIYSYGSLDPNNHTDLKHIDAKAATAAEEGNIAYWYCGGCKKYFSDAAAIKEITKAATVTAKLPPKITAGDGAAVTQGEKKELSFTSDASVADFVRVELDGTALDEKRCV